MPPEEKHPCKDCKWYHAFTAQDPRKKWMGFNYGECHAHPPVFRAKAAFKWQNEWAFPVVDGDNPDTCSDYQ